MRTAKRSSSNFYGEPVLWWLLLLFSLDTLLILVSPVGRDDDQPLGDDKPIPSHIAHHPN